MAAANPQHGFPLHPPAWFDAHLDLACLAVLGRDMFAPAETQTEPTPPVACTLASLREGNVAAFLATIFTEAGGTDAVSYPMFDGEAAHAAGMLQLKTYHSWAAAGHIAFLPRRGEHIAPCPPPDPQSPLPRSPRQPAPLRLGILMESADPIRAPDDVPFWAERGLVAVGMAWARGTRYAKGNASPDTFPFPGLSDLGRALVPELDRLNIVHDLSHLTDAAAAELLALTPRPVMASHSNCRVLVDGTNPRHLPDDLIREIARRGGVIGLNLYSGFLRADTPGRPEGPRATIDDALAHVEHVCTLVGHRRAVGLGSDLDGGFSAARIPEGINHPRDYHRLTDGLRAHPRNWPDEDIHNFTWGNWARFWSAGSGSR